MSPQSEPLSQQIVLYNHAKAHAHSRDLETRTFDVAGDLITIR